MGEILSLNSDITNEPSSLEEVGVDSVANNQFYLDVAIEKGSTLNIDSDSHTINNTVVTELADKAITTYE